MKKYLVTRAIYAVLFISSILALRISGAQLKPLVDATPVIDLGFAAVPSIWVVYLLGINLLGIDIILFALITREVEKRLAKSDKFQA